MQTEQQAQNEKCKRDTLLRQWTLLRMIPRFPKKVSTQDLIHHLSASGFDVGDRKIQRDLNKLSEIFPIESDRRSKPYGWYWPKDVCVMDVPCMDTHTALAFWLAEQHLQPLLPNDTEKRLQGYFKTATQVLGQIHSDKGAAAWQEKVRVLHHGPIRQAVAIDPDIQHEVYEALLYNRRLNVTYQPPWHEGSKEYEINPLGLVFKDSITYLVCSMWDYPDMRQLALHRMLTAQALNIPASTPDGFILDDYIASGELEYPVGDSIELKAWISGNLASLLNERPLSDDQGIEKQDDKQLLLCATVQDTNELRWWLLGFGDQVEVLEPAEFRGYFAEIAANMANAYGTAYDSR